MVYILLILVASLIGIIWGVYLDLKNLIIALIFLSISVLIMFNKHFIKHIKFFFIFVIIFIFFFSYTTIKINNYDHKYSNNNNIYGRLIILSHYEETNYYYRYKVKFNNNKFIANFKKSGSNIFDIGTNIDFNGGFSIPETSRNKGGFNYRYYLYSNNIYGIINVNSTRVIENNKFNIVYFLQNKIRDVFIKIFSDDIDCAGILNGMITGETTDISSEIKNDFKNSGITHLLAVSGSNVALIISMSVFIFSRLFGKNISNYLTILFVILFCLVSGASMSVLRAGIMAILNIVAGILVRKSDTINNILISALILLIINPLAILDVGFILSFGGTIGIILLSKYIRNKLSNFIRIRFILETLSITMAAQIVILPLMAYYFNTISLLSILSNMLIVPIAEPLSVIGIFLLFISIFAYPIANILKIVPYIIIKYIVILSKFFSKLSIANILVPKPKYWMIAYFYTFIAMYVFIDKYKNGTYIFKEYYKNSFRFIIKLKRIFLGSFIFITAINLIYNCIPKSYIELTNIDVGQGDSFLIVTNDNNKILIDGGGSEIGDYDVGANVLLPYLLNRWILKIDTVIVSHAHADHIDGIYTVLENLKVNNVIIGPQNDNDEKIQKLYEICKRKGIKIIHVSKGDKFKIDNVLFEVIYPDKNYKNNNVNNLSLVLKMIYKNRVVLFTGDIESDTEESIKTNVKADILKVAHHGSKTSTSETFLAKVKPKISIIGVSKNNTFGHPSDTVIERLSKYSDIYMTKDYGEINIKIFNNGIIKVKKFIEDSA